MVMLQKWLALMKGEWSCYRGGKFNGGRMVLLQKWSACLMEGKLSCYRGGKC